MKERIQNNERIAPSLDDDFCTESYELRKTASTMIPVVIDWFRRQAGVL